MRPCASSTTCLRCGACASMSSRAAELLREDIEAQPPQRKHVVEEAQGRIVAVVRRLEEGGQIELNGGSDEEEVEELV